MPDQYQRREPAVHAAYSAPPRAGASHLYEEPDEDDANMVHQRMEDPGWSIDRGAGFYSKQRMKNKQPALVESGRCATG